MSADDRARWDARWSGASPETGAPSPFLSAHAAWLPAAGRALDVAGGVGRNALWLAARGLEVTVADVSQVGLDKAAARARERGLSLETVCVDLEEAPLPDGPWALVVCTLFLHRPLFAAIPRVLSPGGVFVFVQPTATNLERHPKPSRRFLLEPNELETLLPPALEVVVLDESWSAEGHHEARLIARRRAAP